MMLLNLSKFYHLYVKHQPNNYALCILHSALLYILRSMLKESDSIVSTASASHRVKIRQSGSAFCPPRSLRRVKTEDEKLKIAGVLELADKQASDTCVFNMRVQVPSPAPSLKSLENTTFSRLFTFLFSPMFRWQTHR